MPDKLIPFVALSPAGSVTLAAHRSSGRLRASSGDARRSTL